MFDTLERMQKQGTPLIDGEKVTFVWLGKKAPRLRGDFRGWEAEDGLVLKKIGTNLWGVTLTLPEDGYFEYCFFEKDERLLDPSNRQVTPNGMGKYNNFFWMPQAAPTPLAKVQRGVPKGAVKTVEVDLGFTLSTLTRKVTFYQPPVASPSPLMVVWDGSDYLRRAKLPTMVDNLIAAGRIQPLALAMVPNGGRSRFSEYACSDATLAALIGHILPEAQKQLNLVDISTNPGAFGVMGASMGGLMALYAGLRFPGIFGKVLAQSGAYAIRGYEFVSSTLVRAGNPQALKIWMDCGKYEFLTPANRDMHSLLTSCGYSVPYREYNAGHNYPAWRDDLWRGLEYLFPPLKG